MSKVKGHKKDTGGKSPTKMDPDLELDDTVRSEAGDNNSSVSDGRTINLDDASPLDSGDDQVDQTASMDHLESILKDEMENAISSTAATRVKALTALNVQLVKRFLTDFVGERQESFVDIVERSLRRGKPSEQFLAARLASVLCIQLGSDCGELYGKLRPTLLTTFMDPTLAASSRAGCAEALGIGSFISEEEPEDFQEIVQKLSKTFSGSYQKGDGKVPHVSADVAELHRRALMAWSLLLTVASNEFAADEIGQHIQKIPQLLGSESLDLRIAAGETIALMNELIRDFKLRIGFNKLPAMDSLCDKLKQLATETSKHRAKKDQKFQRSSFREVLHSVQDGDGVFQRVRFGKEVLDLHTWRAKHQYDSFCNLLQGGLNCHLRVNPLIRDIFELGDVLPEEKMLLGQGKSDKFQKQLLITAANKERTQARNVERGNRQARKEYFDDED